MTPINKQQLRAGHFIVNNGYVLRTINILRHKYNKLLGICNALKASGIAEDEFLDSVNFLAEAGYIHLRRIDSKAEAELADNNYDELEAKLTAQGIRLLAGEVNDAMIEV